MSKKAFTDVPAGSPNLPIIGSIQCVWYDDPRRDYDFGPTINLGMPY